MADKINGIDAILNKIREYGDQTAQKLIDDSSERAGRIFSDAEAEVNSFSADFESGLELEMKAYESQAAGDYAAVVRDKTLAMKQEVLSETFDRAVKLLSELPSEKKLALYRKWISQNGEQCDYEIILNKADKEMLGKDLKSDIDCGLFPGRPVISEKETNASGGIVLNFGDTRTDITFETVVSLEKGKYDTELIGILFPDG